MLSHTVGLEHDEMFQKYRSYTQLSPSHTVGSELLGIFSIKACRKQVTIPHSGLGTAQHYNKAFNSLDVSSSHTVGLEPMIHAIQRIYYEESPSHAVGLELTGRGKPPSCWWRCVTIPHGGLRTQRSQRPQQAAQGQSVTIPHGGLRTVPIKAC